MINLNKKERIYKNTHIKKIDETNKMLNETLKIIDNYKKKILNEKKN